MSATPHPISGGELSRLSTKFEWEDRVAALVLRQSVKLVAFGLSHFADRDGTSAHPGQLRLMWYCGISDERTVRNALTKLRELGLIYRAEAGGGRPRVGKKAKADEWILCWPTSGVVAAPSITFDEWRKRRGA